jgi:uncharacterized OB-fold protein
MSDPVKPEITKPQILMPQTGPIPAPHPTLISQPYWDAARRSELLVQRCRACSGYTHTPALLCAQCAARDLEWVISAGTGTVYSWTSVWRPQTPAFVVPYVPLIVDMDEGWQMLANLVDAKVEDVHVGLRVKVVFHPLNDEITLPYFRPL